MLKNRHRVLVIIKNDYLRFELVTLLSGYGYHVEDCENRLDGMRKFRAHKQPIIIFDVPTLRTFSKRIFTLIRLVQRHAIVLIAATKKEDPFAFDIMKLGAYDILNVPLKTEFLIHTLARAQEYHTRVMENIFVKNFIFLILLLAPIWIYTVWLLAQ